MRESRAALNAWGPVSIANTMVSRCRSTIGKRPANTTCDTFRSIPTDENGAIAKVEQSTPNLTSCGPCTSGVTRSSRMRRRRDKHVRRVAAIKHQGAGLVPALGFEPERQPPLGVDLIGKLRLEGNRLHAYSVDPCQTQ